MRTAIPSMCALFIRGFSRCEMCQGARRGVDTEGVAKADKLECKQSKRGAAATGKGRTEGYSNRPAEEGSRATQIGFIDMRAPPSFFGRRPIINYQLFFRGVQL